MVKSTETISKQSKGVIKNFYNTAKTLSDVIARGGYGVIPEFDREKALEAIRKDSTVVSAIKTLVDSTIKNGYKTSDVHKEVLKKIRFDKVLRQTLYNIYLYNNVFIENVKDGNKKVKEANVLETTTTSPVCNSHGKILGYTQLTVPGKPIIWKDNEITFIPESKVTTDIWGEIDIQSIWSSIMLKQYIMDFLSWLFGTNQFRGFFNVEGSSTDQVKDFISNWKAGEQDVTRPMIGSGKINYALLRKFDEGEKYINLLNKCDSTILTLLQVPPVSAGQPGDSNRSSSDAEVGSLNTRIKSIQLLITEAFNNDLFVKMGLENVDFEFNTIDKIDVERLIKNAERLVNMGFKKEKIEEYLELEGFPIQGTLFDPNAELEQKKSMDMYASREGKNADTSNERIGTGEKGTTREDQLIKKGKTVLNGFCNV